MGKGFVKMRSIGFAWVMIIGCLLLLSSNTASLCAARTCGSVDAGHHGMSLEGDIGGPMDVTNEYRWNVPVLTYGFDQSFVDYFSG